MVSYHIEAWIIAGVFSLLSVLVSGWEISKHLRFYTNPKHQQKIVRILLMVPIYSICSWFSLRFKDSAIYLDTLRDG